MTRRLLDSWSTAVTMAPALLEPLAAPELTAIGSGLDAIDRHWTTLHACLEKPVDAAADARRRLLAEAPRETSRRWAWNALRALIDGRPMPCPICGNTTYKPGPGGRLSGIVPPRTRSDGSRFSAPFARLGRAVEGGAPIVVG